MNERSTQIKWIIPFRSLNSSSALSVSSYSFSRTGFPTISFIACWSSMGRSFSNPGGTSTRITESPGFGFVFSESVTSAVYTGQCFATLRPSPVRFLTIYTIRVLTPSRDTGRTKDVLVLAGRANLLYEAATSAPLRTQAASEAFHPSRFRHLSRRGGIPISIVDH